MNPITTAAPPTMPEIEIDRVARTVADGLAELLASTWTLNLATQCAHWNIVGPDFAGTHAMFEDQYREMSAAIDIIAEHLRALGQPAPGSLPKYLAMSAVDMPDLSTRTRSEMLRLLAEGHASILAGLEAIRHAYVDIDLATEDLLSARARAHRKAHWMLMASQG